MFFTIKKCFKRSREYFQIYPFPWSTRYVYYYYIIYYLYFSIIIIIIIIIGRLGRPATIAHELTALLLCFNRTDDSQTYQYYYSNKPKVR